MLREARREQRGVELPEILEAGIAQFTARIFELRRGGFGIKNKLGRDEEGQIRSRYFLVRDPERDDNEHER
jgi:hypothetical protein